MAKQVFNPLSGGFDTVLSAADELSYDNTTSGLSATEVQSAIDEVEVIASAAIPASEKGANDGVAELDSNGKVPANQLPSSVMEYLGTWAASTNTPTLADGVGDAGDVYIANDAGTVDFGSGDITFAAGDWVIYNGTIWEKSSNSISANSVDGTIIRLANDQFLRARNAADDGDIDILKVDNADSVVIYGGTLSINATTRKLLDSSEVEALDWSGSEIVVSKSLTPITNGTVELGSSSLGIGHTYFANNRTLYWLNAAEDTTYAVLRLNASDNVSLLAEAGDLYLGAQGGSLLIDSNDEKIKITSYNGTIAPQIEFYDADGTNYAAIKSPNVLSGDYVLTLPANDGAVNSIMSSDGGGNLSFATSLADSLAVISLDWFNRTLHDDTGTEALNWNGTDIILSKNLVPVSAGTVELGSATLGLSTINIANNRSIIFRNGADDANYAVLRMNASNNVSLLAEAGDVYIGAQGGSLLLDSNTESVKLTSYNGSVAPQIEFYEADGTSFIAIKAADSIAGNTVFTLPVADGTADQVIVTDGSGNLSFASPAVSKKEQITLTAPDITAGYIDLQEVAKNDSIDFVFNGLVSSEGVDYSVSYTGGISGETRIDFSSHSPALSAGDVINVKYMY